MRSYINLFLTLVMPISILFTAIATVYFSMNYEFSKAIKLGTLAGAIIGVTISLFVALVIIILRVIRIYRIKKQLLKTEATSLTEKVTLSPTIYERKHQSVQKNLIPKLESIEEKFMLLMDKELAYEITLNSIDHQNIGDIIHQNKKKGSILLRNKNEEIKIQVSSLTKHTAQVLIYSTIESYTVKNIIAELKEKEHSFIQY